MLINGLLIEVLREAEASAVACDAVLCRYDEPQWMGIRRDRAHTTSGEAAEARIETVTFPRRTVQVENGRRRRFTTHEPWTVPAWTLYLVSPPAGYYLQSSRLDDLGGGEITKFHPASDTDSLYYFALLQGDRGQVAFGSEMHFDRYSAAARRLARPGVGGPNWPQLWRAAAAPLAVAGDIASVAELIHTIVRLA